MTRKEALKEYVECEKIIDNLIIKRSNLEKIILGEIVPPDSRIITKQKRKSNFGPKGITQEKVAKALSEHGGKLTIKEIATLTDLRADQVNAAVYKLYNLHLVNKHKDAQGPVYWSIAIHRDKSELNHL